MLVRRGLERHYSPPPGFGLECLPLSPYQLRELWDYDNECGKLIMGAPLRSCSCREDVSTGGGISEAEFLILKSNIKDMWEKASTIFEIFYDSKQPELGYRLRVKLNMPLKITLKGNNELFFGWCASAPLDSPCSHLYDRSPVKPQGYLGGPASYCNWATGKQATVDVIRPTRSSARYLVRLECKNLSAGTELAWNYGSNQEMPLSREWFKQCCSVINSSIKRQEKKRDLKIFMNIEKCVLCGKPYSSNNKDNRIQRKPHFINSHADFLGSAWNGLNSYQQEVVDGCQVLAEADKLNEFLQTLHKKLHWQIVPACMVISSEEKERYGNDHEALLNEFKRRCFFLKDSGTLVIRGLTIINRVKDLNVNHLAPIPPSVWRILRWNADGPPPVGLCGVPNKNEEEQSADILQIIVDYFKCE